MSLTQSLAFPVLKDAAIFLEIKGSKKNTNTFHFISQLLYDFRVRFFKILFLINSR